MMDDFQMIEAAQRAERIKAAAPYLAVSTDAIFTAIVLGKRKPGRPAFRPRVAMPEDAPAWFEDALKEQKGKALTIGKFMLFAGRFPYCKKEAYAIGRWLRASGRMPRKCGGQQLFDI